MTDFTEARERMVERQIAARGIEDRSLLEAMRSVPREAFVPDNLVEFAYEDSPLPIESGQTISQPYIVAMMIEAAEVRPGDKVLEIGAGSGYAAAVLGRIAYEVLAIERHHELAEIAGSRLERLGYTNVDILEGDGTEGLPEEAPFDAILAAASGSHVPEALLQQLAIGGRLVMPVGEPHSVQMLVRVTRIDDEEFEREDLGPVRFVPLIGAHGWEDSRAAGQRASAPQLVREAAEPFADIDSAQFSALFDRFADARVVMLGEASHGTSEFYRARAAISRHLIEHHGFGIVTAEADWPDAAHIDRYVRHRRRREGEEVAFQRFPTWMWRNREVDEFVRWLREHNEARAPEEMAGFYGLDLYNMNASIRAVIDYLDDVDPEAAGVARERYGCLKPYGRNPASYGQMAITEGYARCERPVLEMLRELQAKRIEYAARDGDEWLDAASNARLVKNAEAYYRVMYYGSGESWNLRDSHMFETLCQILNARGPEAKAIVWAHNSHIGNAAFTEMGQVRDQHNIGQLAKEKFGDSARLIGFGTHGGTVAAASDWDGPMEVKVVRPSMAGSYERLCHEAGVQRFLLDLREGENEEVAQTLTEPRLERYIGVIYRPETERWSHYSQSILPKQYDGWVWFDHSKAVTPLAAEPRKGEDDMWPFGL